MDHFTELNGSYALDLTNFASAMFSSLALGRSEVNAGVFNKASSGHVSMTASPALPLVQQAISSLIGVSTQHQVYLAILLSLLLASLVSSRASSSREKEFLAFKATSGCQNGPTIAAPNLAQKIKHKYSLLFPRKGTAIDNFALSFAKHGQTYLLERSKAMPRSFYTVDRRNAAAVLDKQAKDWELHANRMEVSKPVAKGGIFFAENHDWLTNRKLGIRNVGFGTKRAKNAERFEPDVQMLFRAIGSAGEGEWTGCVDMADMLHRATGDMITHQLLGIRPETQLQHINENSSGQVGAVNGQARLNQDKKFILQMLGRRSMMGQWNWLGDSLSFRVACRNFKRSVDGIIKQALQHSRDAAAAQTDSVSLAQSSLIAGLWGSTSDSERIRDVVVDMLIAGEQASGTVLAFWIGALAQQQQIFHDIRGEVLAAFGTEDEPKADMTWDSLKACKSLQWSILETLRLYGPVAVIARQARCNTTLPHGGGPDGEAPLAVPKGAGIMVFSSMMHKRQDYWGEDADQFRPSRWEGRKYGPEWAAFGQGKRLCIGQQISMTEMSYVAARFLQHYCELDAPEPQANLEKKFDFVVSPKNGVNVRLRRSG